MNHTHRWAWLLTLLLTTAPALALPVSAPHVEAELVAETLQLQTGDRPNWVALRLQPEPGWHVYWQNPGDSGLPTRMDWDLPDGVSAGDIHWPYPHRESLGELSNYGYSAEVLHLVPIHVAVGSASPVMLKATARWLVCADICIPGSADLQLSLPLTSDQPAPDPIWQAQFAATRALLPVPLPDADARFSVDERDFSLAIAGTTAATLSEPEFFPILHGLVNHAAPQRFARDLRGLRMSQALSAYYADAPSEVHGVLVGRLGDGRTQAFAVDARPAAVEAVAAVAAGSAVSQPPTVGATPLLLVLGFALLGGLILNLMPCVFPVLSLKALSIMQAPDSGHDHRRHALVYTAGVLLSFLVIGALLMALRLSGASIGWGFQLQSPLFVAALVYLLFLIGLSLSGYLAFGMRWMGMGQNLTERPGYGGSFFTGVLAVVVASPCTAPFMGVALGFALTQPALIAMLVFVALGLGLALPFLLLGLFPALGALLPRPGAWMERFRQALAFPIYLSVVWLLWVLGGLTDRNGMALILIGTTLLAFAAWLMTAGAGRFARGLAVASVAAALALLAHPGLRSPSDPAFASHADTFEAYSDERYEELRQQGRTVFVDFTADWCITCKVNERIVLRSKRIQSAFKEHEVTMLVGDWTRADPEITAVLQRYGRSGVPLYLLSQNGAEAEVLPQLLTPELLVQRLTQVP